MKILHLINTLSAGGAELHLLRLLPRLREANLEIVLMCLKSSTPGSRSLVADFMRAGIRVIDLEADHRLDLHYLVAFSSLVAQEKPDLIHTHLPRADLAGLVASRLRTRVPWVCTVHDIHSQSWSARWLLPFFNPIWRSADRIIAISGAVRDWLIGARHVPPAKIRVIYYGVDLDEFASIDGTFRQRWGVTGGPVVGTIGRLEARKGHDILIGAFSEVLRQIPTATLVIAGHDPWGYGRVLQQRIARSELTDRVRLVGFQSNVAAFLGAIDVFAFASRSEGFGQVVIEAMAAGKPVVASRIAPLTEIVEAGKSGILVPLEDTAAWARAIVRLLRDPPTRVAMGRMGRERVRSAFSVDAMVSATVQVYDAVLRSRVVHSASVPL